MDVSEDNLANITRSLGLEGIKRHIFLCCDQTKPKCCDKADGLKSWDYLKRRLKELRLEGNTALCRTKPIACKCVSRVPSGWFTRRGFGTAPAPRKS